MQLSVWYVHILAMHALYYYIKAFFLVYSKHNYYIRFLFCFKEGIPTSLKSPICTCTVPKLKEGRCGKVSCNSIATCVTYIPTSVFVVIIDSLVTCHYPCLAYIHRISLICWHCHPYLLQMKMTLHLYTGGSEKKA